ncbi:hypothetical protein [Rhodopirellula sp. SWK7]|uniref:hypothetical protein n=1 Tax=Rhodopirellula sp. SWK7 TaxID=595460 RepID=UPI0011819A6B|nr:hypothetical protein [Rhodopirellula sp. SWK7]
MYHLPPGMIWDAVTVATALRERGVKASIEGDRVRLTLPVQRWNIDAILDGDCGADLAPEIVGESIATLSFVPNVILSNVVLKLPESFLLDLECVPRITEVTDAILSCGYASGSDREFADQHWKGSTDMHPIFDEIDNLQIAIEQAVAEHRYEDARAILDSRQSLRQSIEDVLRESFTSG